MTENEQLKIVINAAMERISENSITPEQLIGFMGVLVQAVKDASDRNQVLSDETKLLVEEAITSCEECCKEIEVETEKKVSASDVYIKKEVAALKNSFKAFEKEIRSIELKDGKDADEEKIVKDVLAQIKFPEVKDVILDDGDAIVAKINDCDTTDDDCKIDWAHIKNAPDFGAGKNFVAGNRFLDQLIDVNVTGLTKDSAGRYLLGAASTSIGGTITGGTAGSVLFVGAGATIAQDNANFFWSTSTNSLQIGGTTYAYSAPLQVTSAVSGPGGFNTGLVLRGAAPSIVLEDTTGADIMIGNENGDLFFYDGASATTAAFAIRRTQNNTIFYMNTVWGTDNTYDIGASGANRPRTGYFGGSVYVGTANLVGVDTNNSTFYSSTDNGMRSSGNLYLVADTNNSGGESIIFGRGSAAFGSITTNWSINGSGHFLAGADNTYDFGTSTANRLRNLYTAGLTFLGKQTGGGNTQVVTIGHNGTTSSSNDGVSSLIFKSQFGTDTWKWGAEGNGYNFYMRQTNGGQGTFAFDFGTISTVAYRNEYKYITDHYENILTGKWLTTFSGNASSNYYGFRNSISPNSTSVFYDTFRIERAQNTGNYPQSSDPLLSLFAGDSTTTETATNRYVARINRIGFLGIGTTNTYADSAHAFQAAITIDMGSKTGVKMNDGTTALQVRTSGSSTSVVCLGGVNGENALGIQVGTKITANGVTRTVVSLSSAQGFVVDSAVNWDNGGVGYNFTYTNPYLSFQDGTTKYFTIAANGDTLIAGVLDLGNASDTTISRVSAGKIAIEGVNILTSTSTETVTNKRFTPRVYTATNNASLTPEIDTYDVFHLTAMSANTTINNHSTSTPADGETMRMRFLDNGTARTLTWGSNYVAKAGVALPTTTTISKNLVVLFEWNANLGKWNLLSSGLEA